MIVQALKSREATQKILSHTTCLNSVVISASTQHIPKRSQISQFFFFKSPKQMVTRTGALREKNFFLFALVRKDLAQKVKSGSKKTNGLRTSKFYFLSNCRFICSRSRLWQLRGGGGRKRSSRGGGSLRTLHRMTRAVKGFQGLSRACRTLFTFPGSCDLSQVSKGLVGYNLIFGHNCSNKGCSFIFWIIEQRAFLSLRNGPIGTQIKRYIF